MRYPITPVPKPRMTRRDVWDRRKPVMRYRAFCDQVRACGVKLPVSGADVRFIMPMPPSWSKKKRAEFDGKPHQKKPDLSNLLKALEDALYIDDAEIWHYATLCKRWGQTGAIIIEIEVSHDGEEEKQGLAHDRLYGQLQSMEREAGGRGNAAGDRGR